MIVKLLLLQVALVTVFSQEWELVWQDEFDGEEINQSNWQWEITAWGGGNSEFQVYTPANENSWVRDGKLYIRPTLLEENINPLTDEPFGAEFLNSGVLDLEAMYGNCTGSENNGCYRTGANGDITPVASARLRSYQRFAFKYGRVEVRAKMPVGDWLWPAMWFLPEQWCYGDWPTSGEMDLTESIGNEDLRFEDGNPAGIQKMGSTMHWGVSRDQNRYYLTGSHNNDEENHYGNMHDYAMEWTPNGISYFIDGYNLLNVPDPLIDQNVNWTGFFDFGKPWFDNDYNPWTVNNDPLMTPFDTQFHMLLNIAVGGTNGFIPENAINRGGDPAYAKPWTNGLSQVEAMNQFYDARGQDESSGWLWTWTKERNAADNDCMQVEYVRIYKDTGLPPETDQCP